MKLKIILSTLVAIAISQTSVAQNTQKERIKNGVKNGEITKVEKEIIKEKRKETQVAIKEAKLDGVVTPEEKKEIEKQRKQASKTIYHKKHNNIVRK